MSTTILKYAKYILIFLFACLLICLWEFPLLAPAIGIAFLLFSLAMAVLSIFTKYQQAENARGRIFKDVLIVVVTLLLIIFLGGLAGMFANYYVGPRFGAIAGFVSAIAASFLIGYWVKKGVSLVLENSPG